MLRKRRRRKKRRRIRIIRRQTRSVRVFKAMVATSVLK
jgi:hypothetical protein